MSRRSSHNPFDNPYHKEQPPGSQCFYIYNDDGTPVTGPTGPKYCFSEAKAKAMVAQAERAGFRVSPSAVSPGPRRAAAPPPYRAPVSGPVQFIESRFELLRPILNHHLVMSVERPHRGGEGATGKARTVQGIHPRSKYAVIHSGLRADGTVRPEFAVNMATMEISRADYDGQPREGWNYGTLDEVIARGRTLKPRENPYTDDQQPFADLAPNVEGTLRCAVCNGTGVEDDGRLCMDCSGTGRVAAWKQRKQRRQGAGTLQAVFRSGKVVTMTPAQVLKMPKMFTSATVEAAKKAAASGSGKQNPSYGTLVEDRIRLRDMLEELPQPEKTKKVQVAQVRASRGKGKKSRSNPAEGGELPTLKQFQQAVARVAPSSKVDIGDEPNSLAFRDLNGQYLGAVTFSKRHVRFINRGNTTVLNMRGLATAVARVGNAVFRGHMTLYSAVRDYAKNVLSVDGFNEYYSAAGVKVSRRSKAVVANPGPGFTPTEWFADVEDSEWANWDLNRAGIMHWPGGQ
jgi:hypothetical protein